MGASAPQEGPDVSINWKTRFYTYEESKEPDGALAFDLPQHALVQAGHFLPTDSARRRFVLLGRSHMVVAVRLFVNNSIAVAT